MEESDYILYESSPSQSINDDVLYSKQIDMNPLDNYDYKLCDDEILESAQKFLEDSSQDISPTNKNRDFMENSVSYSSNCSTNGSENNSGRSSVIGSYSGGGGNETASLSDIDTLTLSCFSKNKYKKFLKNMNFEDIRDIDYKKYRHEIMDYTNLLLEDNNNMAAHNKKIQTAFEDYVYHLTQHFDFEENLLQDKEYRTVGDYDFWVDRGRGGGGGYK
jgi:hypothetical protein